MCISQKKSTSDKKRQEEETWRCEVPGRCEKSKGQRRLNAKPQPKRDLESESGSCALLHRIPPTPTIPAEPEEPAVPPTTAHRVYYPSIEHCAVDSRLQHPNFRNILSSPSSTRVDKANRVSFFLFGAAEFHRNFFIAFAPFHYLAPAAHDLQNGVHHPVDCSAGSRHVHKIL